MYDLGLAYHEKCCGRDPVYEFSAMAVCQAVWAISMRAAAVPIREVSSTLG